jgi:hypothetical protein
MATSTVAICTVPVQVLGLLYIAYHENISLLSYFALGTLGIKK